MRAQVPVDVILLGGTAAGDDLVRREAVRAVVAEEGALLLLHSAAAGDVKFPGGGREPGETDHGCLARELAEECGRGLAGVPELVLTVVERRPATERPGAVFEMVSRYYRCGVTAQVHEQELEPDEVALGLTPRWVTLAEALATNRQVVDRGSPPPWTARELAVLTWLAEDGRGEGLLLSPGHRP